MLTTFQIEKDEVTNLYVGYLPGIPGAYSQGETIEELRENMAEVLAMVLEE